MRAPGGNEPRAGHVTLEGREVPYTVRRHPRARKVWIKVEEPHGVVVVLPRWGRLRDAPDILKKHGGWVLTTLERHEARRAQAPPPFGTGPTVPYRGRTLPLTLTEAQRPKVALTRRGFVVAVPPSAAPTKDERPEASPSSGCSNIQLALPFLEGPRPSSPDSRPRAAAAALTHWYRRRAATLLARRVALHAPRLGVSPARITVRDAKTRWGSCSPKGVLSFSWRLLMAPPPILDYLVLHELCHMVRADHSVKFWALVARHCPEFQTHRKWLRENAQLLRG